MSTSTRVMRCLLLLSVGAAWLGVRVWGAAPATAAATTILESSALRVEVTAAPYSYAVIEKTTGQLPLRQSQTTFTVGTARSASTAAIGNKSATSVRRNNRTLPSGDFQYDAATRVMTIPLSGATSVEIRR